MTFTVNLRKLLSQLSFKSSPSIYADTRRSFRNTFETCRGIWPGTSKQPASRRDYRNSRAHLLIRRSAFSVYGSPVVWELALRFSARNTAIRGLHSCSRFHSSRLTESLSLFDAVSSSVPSPFSYGTLPYHPSRDLSPRSDPDVGLGLRPRRFFPSSTALSLSLLQRLFLIRETGGKWQRPCR